MSEAVSPALPAQVSIARSVGADLRAVAVAVAAACCCCSCCPSSSTCCDCAAAAGCTVGACTDAA
eukprot:6562647-Heterocapsa_arctica.AAC.1